MKNTSRCKLQASHGERRVVMFTLDRKIDRRILLEADSLEQSGWSVDVLAMPWDEEADDSRVHRIGNEIDTALRQAHLLVRIYYRIRSFFPLNSLPMRALRAFGWAIVAKPVDLYLGLFELSLQSYPGNIFVAHDLPMLPVAARAAKLYGGRLVYDSHEYFTEQELTALEKRIWSKLEGKYISNCDAVITVNTSIAKALEKRYSLPTVHVIYNAEKNPVIDKYRGNYFNSYYGFDEDDRIILFQGGYSEGRNIATLVRAMERITCPDCHLVLLGEGTLRKKLEKLTRKLGLENRVHFHESVPQQELLGLTTSADIGVIPYQDTCLNNRFCTPNKLFEFIAAGIPVLATDLPELRAIITKYDIGRVGDTSSPVSFAKLLDSVLLEKGVLEKLRIKVQRAREEVNWDVEGSRLVRIYEKLA